MSSKPKDDSATNSDSSGGADREAGGVDRGAGVMVDKPPADRTFTTTRRVSIDDAAGNGRMELDAIARFLQDAGNDDTDDAGLAELGLAWVARRTAIEVRSPAAARELLTLTTWCSGTGRRWAERRTSIVGEHGASIEASAVWIHLDATTGRPIPWGDGFASNYLEAAGNRQIDAKLRHAKALPDGLDDNVGEPWAFRKTDHDGFGHVNNAAYLAIAEEYLNLDGPCRVEIEWRAPSQANEPLTIHHHDGQLWVIAEDKTLRATITASTL